MLARGAAAAQDQVAQDGDVFQRADAVTALRTLRSGHDQVIAGSLGSRLAGQFGALRAPTLLEHSRDAVDNDIEEAADAKTDYRGGDGHADEVDAHRSPMRNFEDCRR